MYAKIKEMADEALKLQNKNFMDETLKKIIAVCEGMEPLKATELSESALEEFIGKTSKIVEVTGIPFASQFGYVAKVTEDGVYVDTQPDAESFPAFGTGIAAQTMPETTRENEEIRRQIDGYHISYTLPAEVGAEIFGNRDADVVEMVADEQISEGDLVVTAESAEKKVSKAKKGSAK